MVLYPKFDTCAVVSLTMQVMVSAMIYKQIILRAAYCHISTIAFAIFQIVKLNVFLNWKAMMWVAVIVLVFNTATLFSTKLIYYKRSVFRITCATIYHILLILLYPI